MERYGLNEGMSPAEPFPAGGVEAVWLAGADEVAACRYDGKAACWTEIVLRDGGRFVPCEVVEDEASYVQRMQGKFSLWYIAHELVWRVPVAGGRAAALVERLRELDGRGIVALVCLASGDTLLAGWSADFGGERPLRLASVEADTAAAYAEDPVVRVTLRSCDVACSRPYAGDVAGLL